jgi:predicted outer membrane repeat protein
MSRALLVLAAFTMLAAAPAGAATIRVPGDYPLIADALVFADPGDTVLVSCGTYHESGLQMKPGVTLTSATGQASCVSIDAQYLGRIMSCVDCGDSTAIIGMRFISGRAHSGYGAGISCTRSSPRLENLNFIFCDVQDDPTSPGGGALGCVDSSPTLTNVEFDGCRVDGSTVGGGGGMMTAGQSSPTLTHVTFDLCDTYGDGWGGGLLIQGDSDQVVRLNDVTFVDNSTATSGGALHVSSGRVVLDDVTFYSNWAHDSAGALDLVTSAACTLRNVVFTENTAANGNGGGLLCEMSPGASATMSNVTFLDNTATGGGGGIACYNSTVPNISYATFARNTADLGGGIYVHGSSFALSNATFCQNGASIAGSGIYVEGPDPFLLDLDTTIIAYGSSGGAIGLSGIAELAITCTDIYYNAGGDWTGPLASLEGVDGNLSTQPLFCELLNSVFTLFTTSPCLPSGNECGVLIGAHGVGCPASGVPEDGALATVRQAAPNPFARSTSLSYELPADEIVTVRVFDVTGRLVRTLLDGEKQPAGRRALVWNGLDDHGRSVAAGVYFLRVSIGADSFERRAVLVR